MFVRSLLLAFVSVAIADGGTAVGHPVPTQNAVGTGLAFTSGAVPVRVAIFDHCDDTFETVEIDATIDPVANDTIKFPPGDICGVRLVLTNRFLLSGTGTAGGTFSLSLGVGQIDIPVDPPVFVPSDGSSGGTWVRFAAANWITADLLDLDPGENLTFGASHPLHNALRDAVRHDSLAW